MTTNGNRCTEWRALASCHVDGELDELQTAGLERHLLSCAACRTWTHDVAAFTALVHGDEAQQPVWTLELRGQAMRRRRQVAAVAATAASAAAVAAFAFGLAGSGFSFSSAGSRIASAPCASCTKKEAVTAVPLSAVAPVHVANPFVEQRLS